MSRRIRDHIRSNVIGYVALFFALGGGAAWATHPGGANTISTGDIQDNQVFSSDVRNDSLSLGGLGAADLRTNSVGQSEVATSGVAASEVLNGSLTGTDIQSNSLGGSQVAESSLGEVPSATVGGFGRVTSGGCAVDSAFVDCVILTVNLPTQSRVLLIGEANARPVPPSSAASGHCKLVTQFGDVPDTLVEFSLHNGDIVPGALVGITGPLGPGSVDFGLDCNESSGSIAYSPDHLAAIAISPG